MSNTKALIEEVKSKLRNFSDVGLLDENSMYREIVLGLKRFGNDVCELHEAVVHVENGRVELPSNFNSLYFAYLCEPLSYESNNVEVHDLQNSIFYTERVENKNVWSECKSCCKETSQSIIRENLYLNTGSVTFYYSNPTLLRLGTKSLNKSCINSKCRNKLVRQDVGTIDINGRMLNANFTEGYIYINYFGLPIDETGNVEIPDTYNGHLEKYLEHKLLAETALNLMASGNGQSLSSLYQEYRRLESISLKNAVADLKMNSINPDNLIARVKRLNRLDTLKYDISWQ